MGKLWARGKAGGVPYNFTIKERKETGETDFLCPAGQAYRLQRTQEIEQVLFLGRSEALEVGYRGGGFAA